MAKKILVFLSRPQSPLPEMQNFATPDGTPVQGALTNDAPLRYLLRRHPDTEELLCVTTPESTPTFQRLVSLLEADGYCGQCTELLYDGVASFEQSVLPTVSASLQPGDTVLLDITGGFRNAMLYLLLICRVLSYRGIRVTEAVYSSLAPAQIVDATPLVQMFDLIGGMQELTSFGSIRTLHRYYAGRPVDPAVQELLAAVEQLKESIDLCRTQQLPERMARFDTTLVAAEQSADPMLQVLLPVFRKKFGSHMDIPQLVRWCIKSEMLQQALTIYNECIPSVLFGPGKLLEPTWALPVEHKAYQDDAMAQLTLGFLQMSYRYTSNGKSAPGHCTREELCRELKSEPDRRRLLQLFGGSCEPTELPEYILENLAVVCSLAFGRNGTGPYRPGWVEHIPKNRNGLSALGDWMEKEHLDNGEAFLAALYRCPAPKLNKLLEAPQWPRLSYGTMRTGYGQVILKVQELMPLFGYTSRLTTRPLQQILGDYVYFRTLRNMTSHANDTSTEDQKLLLADLKNFDYPSPESLGSREVGDLLLDALDRLEQALQESEEELS